MTTINTVKKFGQFYWRASVTLAKPAFWLAIGFFAGCAFTGLTFGVLGIGHPPS